MFGDGAGSRIRNFASLNGNRGKACFFAGSYADNDAEITANQKLIYGFSIGEQKVTFLTSGDYANFNVGDLLMIRSNTGISGTDWSYIEMNEVVYVDVSGNGLTLKYPFPESVPLSSGPMAIVMPKLAVHYIPKTEGTPSYLAKRVQLRDIAVESTLGPWMTRIGCFESTFKNIHILDGESGIYGNAIAYSTWENIFGVFVGRAIEVATGASNSMYSNIRMAYKWRAGNDTSGDVFVVLTGSRNKMIGVTVDAGKAHVFPDGGVPPVYTIANALRLGGSDNIIDDLVLIADNVTSYTISIAAANYFRVARNSIRNSIFRVGTTETPVNSHIRVGSPGTSASIEDLTIDNCLFSGVVSGHTSTSDFGDVIRILGGNRIYVTNSKFNMPATGVSRHINIESPNGGSAISDVSIAGCYFDGGCTNEAIRVASGSKINVANCNLNLQGGAMNYVGIRNVATASPPTDVRISGNPFFGAASSLGVVFEANTTGTVENNVFPNSSYSIDATAVASVVDNRSATSVTLGKLCAVDRSKYGTVFSSPGAYGTWWTFTLPAGLVRAGDVIRIRVNGSALSGATPGTRNLRWWIHSSSSDVYLGPQQLTGTTTDGMVSDLEIQVVNSASLQLAYMSSLFGASLSRESRLVMTSIDFGSGAVTLKFQGLTSSTGTETFLIDAVSIHIDRPFEVVG